MKNLFFAFCCLISLFTAFTVRASEQESLWKIQAADYGQETYYGSAVGNGGIGILPMYDDKADVSYSICALRNMSYAGLIRVEVVASKDLYLSVTNFTEVPEEIRKDLKYYEDKIDKTGPAMSFSVLSLQYARLGEGDKAYELFVQSFRPNQLPSFGVLSEGAGGTNINGISIMTDSY